MAIWKTAICGLSKEAVLTALNATAVDDRMPLITWAKRLAYFTIVYNLIEGVVSIAFGVQEESLALAGFGFDSLIEVASAFLVLWRLRSDLERESPLSLKAERNATFGIGTLFLVLAGVAAVGAISQLIQRHHPESTVPGVIVSLISLSFMFFLWRSKLRIARELSSRTLEADAACSLACIKLSAILLIGSVIFWIAPALWWIDSAATIALTVLIFREGWEAIEHSRRSDFTGGCGCH